MVTNRLRLVLLTFAALLVATQVWALNLNDVVKKVESNYNNIIAFRGTFNQTATLKTLSKIQQAAGDITYKAELDTVKKTKKNNKFKWEYTSPTEQEIISDGKTIWMYFPENRQVYIYDLTDTFQQEASNQGQVPGNFLTSLGSLSTDFNVQWGTPRNRDEKGNYIIELVPKRPMVNVRNVFIVVPKELVSGETPKTTSSAFEGQRCTYDNDTCTGSRIFPVLTSTVYDSYGNMTNIDFSEIEILEANDETVASKKKAWTLPDSMFTYLPAANVEIIKPPLTRSK